MAFLDPVHVGGVTVSKATLHNAEYVAQRDIRDGDGVVIKRAGDVIPQVIRLLDPDRTTDEPAWQMPDTCPVCGGALVREEQEADYYCLKRLVPVQAATADRALRIAKRAGY